MDADRGSDCGAKTGLRHAGGERAGRGRVIVDVSGSPGLGDERRGTGLVQALLVGYSAGAGVSHDEAANAVEANDRGGVRAEQIRGALAHEHEQRSWVLLGIGRQRRHVRDSGVQAGLPALRGDLL